MKAKEEAGNGGDGGRNWNQSSGNAAAENTFEIVQVWRLLPFSGSSAVRIRFSLFYGRACCNRWLLKSKYKVTISKWRRTHCLNGICVSSWAESIYAACDKLHDSSMKSCMYAIKLYESNMSAVMFGTHEIIKEIEKSKAASKIILRGIKARKENGNERQSRRRYRAKYHINPYFFGAHM